VIGIAEAAPWMWPKAISVLAKNEGKAVEYIGLGLVKKPGLPSIMVPTTQERAVKSPSPPFSP